MFAYKVCTPSTAAVTASPQVISGAETQQPILALTILQVPSGVVATISHGQGGDQIPVIAGLRIETDENDPMLDGFFLNVQTAQPGNLSIGVTYLSPTLTGSLPTDQPIVALGGT